MEAVEKETKAPVKGPGEAPDITVKKPSNKKPTGYLSLVLVMGLIITGMNLVAMRYMLNKQSERFSQALTQVHESTKSKIKVIDFPQIAKGLQDEGATGDEMVNYIDLLMQIHSVDGYLVLDSNQVIGMSDSHIIKYIPKERVFAMARQRGLQPIDAPKSEAATLLE